MLYLKTTVDVVPINGRFGAARLILTGSPTTRMAAGSDEERRRPKTTKTRFSYR